MDLVKRASVALRDALSGSDGELLHLIGEMRDRIEADVKRIAELERALRRLEYWLDTDQEILDEMDENERRAHLEMLAIARSALKGNE